MINTLITRIDQAIEDVFLESEKSGLSIDKNVKRYVKLGKKVRPLSLLLRVAARDTSLLDDSRVYRVAAAIEIAHRSTLVSDDVVDGQQERNGLPTIEATVGRSVAVLTAPFLQSFAVNVCLSEFRDILNIAIRDTLAGQILQENQNYLSIAQCKHENARIVKLKSSSIESAALYIGNLLLGFEGTKTPYKLGNYLAKAYQTCNDLSDLDGWLHGATKDLPPDIRNRTYTYPILLAIHKSSKRRRQQLLRYMEGHEEVDHSMLRDIILETDTYSHCMTFINENVIKARDTLARILPRTNFANLFIDCVENTWKAQYLKT
jgi:geranylgeranyl pyrophosphate synthase